MKISSHSMNRLLSIDWFSNVGNQLKIPSIKIVKSSSDANQYISAPEWEDVTLEAANDISGFLAINHSIVFQNWNNIAKDAKIFLEKEVIEKIPDIDGFDTLILSQCVSWDIVHYLIEDTYKDKLKKPLFFEKLIEVYESGHLPCGWDGEWPNGNLIVY
ncbi:hypothetical protein CE143_15995 [Photorhabdus luminescens]|uniref:Cytoplasmic protein n=1 Tax=Photorhabdus akhurstii TaxID=171438 RepID=A0ABX8M034_9GAMM|nr:hypothetical protein [Photorhabdus akhurstii]MBS9429828.1 hypothetical protein [Photorhabdus akhurstii]QXF34487.1 hypothetical protein B0X70_16000 [Photorhabdus akhurstii]UJD76311.1 hypothetical protein CE143_15995 [Photorhabdus luminescens]